MCVWQAKLCDPFMPELIELWFYFPLDTKLRRSSQPISWFSTEKLKQTQQKQTCIRNKIYTAT